MLVHENYCSVLLNIFQIIQFHKHSFSRLLPIQVSYVCTRDLSFLLTRKRIFFTISNDEIAYLLLLQILKNFQKKSFLKSKKNMIRISSSNLRAGNHGWSNNRRQWLNNLRRGGRPNRFMVPHELWHDEYRVRWK